MVMIGVALDGRDESGNTALHFAIDRGHADITGMLLDGGADLHAEDNDGNTPLMLATLREDEVNARFLALFILFNSLCLMYQPIVLLLISKGALR
jgi:ankyrin repeat protein